MYESNWTAGNKYFDVVMALITRISQSRIQGDVENLYSALHELFLTTYPFLKLGEEQREEIENKFGRVEDLLGDEANNHETYSLLEKDKGVKEKNFSEAYTILQEIRKTLMKSIKHLLLAYTKKKNPSEAIKDFGE